MRSAGKPFTFVTQSQLGSTSLSPELTSARPQPPLQTLSLAKFSSHHLCSDSSNIRVSIPASSRRIFLLPMPVEVCHPLTSLSKGHPSFACRGIPATPAAALSDNQARVWSCRRVCSTRLRVNAPGDRDAAELARWAVYEESLPRDKETRRDWLEKAMVDPARALERAMASGCAVQAPSSEVTESN